MAMVTDTSDVITAFVGDITTATATGTAACISAIAGILVTVGSERRPLIAMRFAHQAKHSQ